MAFFFSAVATQGNSQPKRKLKAQGNEREQDSEESNDVTATSSQIASTNSQEWIEEHRTIIDRKFYPAISYWITLTTPNGALANPLTVHGSSMAMKELYKTLKDHKNSFMQNLIRTSYQTSYRSEAEHFIEDPDTLDLHASATVSVVRVVLVNQSFQSTLSAAISKIEDAKLQIDCFRFNESDVESNGNKVEEPQRLSDSLALLISDIGIAMKKLEYALYRGKIYKKEPQARYTCQYKCKPRAFVNSLAAKEFFKARFLKDMKRVIDIVSDPYWEVTRPIRINCNLIQVNGGLCWSVKERKFIVQAIKDNAIGLVSPRAFCSYDSTTSPNPQYFKEILENSLSENEVATFCDDFLRLLHFNQKKHKDKVPCLVGETSSGKTSLFLPILGVIHHTNVATITKQRVFNKATITNNTEVIFIDEAPNQPWML